MPTLKEIEKAAIEDTLKACGNNKTEAAKILGISVRGLRNKLTQHGLHHLKGTQHVPISKAVIRDCV